MVSMAKEMNTFLNAEGAKVYAKGAKEDKENQK
jgi:hypothetical protein